MSMSSSEARARSKALKEKSFEFVDEQPPTGGPAPDTNKQLPGYVFPAMMFTSIALIALFILYSSMSVFSKVITMLILIIMTIVYIFQTRPINFGSVKIGGYII